MTLNPTFPTNPIGIVGIGDQCSIYKFFQLAAVPSFSKFWKVSKQHLPKISNWQQLENLEKFSSKKFPACPSGQQYLFWKFFPGVKMTPSKKFQLWKKMEISKNFQVSKRHCKFFPFFPKISISKNFHFWEKMEIPKISIFFWKKFPWKFFPENSASTDR